MPFSIRLHIFSKIKMKQKYKRGNEETPIQMLQMSVGEAVINTEKINTAKMPF